MLNDPIADLLTRIRNAKDAKHRYIDIRFSKMKKAIAEVLKDQRFVKSVHVSDDQTTLRVYLKYYRRESIISNLQRVSRPSQRKYVAAADIPKIQRGLGVAVISTPKGIMDGEAARHSKVGGELLCVVW